MKIIIPAILLICILTFSLEFSTKMKPRSAYPGNLEDLADAGFFEPVSIDYSEIEADSDVFKSSELPPLTMFGGVPDEIGKRNPAFVRFRRDDGRLILEGTVAKEVKKETMHRVARSLQWIDSVENHVEIDHRCEGLPGGDKGSGFLTALLEQAANGEIRIENDRVILSGEVYEAKTKSLLLSKALSFSDGRSVINHLKVIAPVLMVSVDVKPDSVHLRGFLPEEETHKEFLSAIWKALPGKQMKDDIIVSEKMASTAMAMRLPSFVGTFFAGVPNGSFEIRESRLRLSGDAGEWSERDALIMDVKNTLEYSVEIDDFLVANAPEGLWESLSLSVTKDGVDVTLEGKLPSGKLKSQLTASVALAFPRARVVDNVEVLSEGGWVSFTEKLPRFWDHFLARVEDPSFVLQNGTLGLFGKLDEPLERASLASRASGMLGLKVKVDSHLDGSELPSAEAITLIDRESLHERFRSLPIFFGVNRTSVQDSEMAKVKELAGLMKKSGLPLIISGFADRKGDPEYNRELGLKRAASVKRALEKLGVDTDGMEVESVVAEESGKEVRRVEVKAAQVKRA